MNVLWDLDRQPLSRFARLLILSLAIAGFPDGSTGHPGQASVRHAGTGQLQPAMILWRAGTAAGTIETITPAVLGNRKTWRVTHYSQDPAAEKVNDYDLYDLDQETLAPLRSVMNTEQFHLELVFTEKEVTLHKSTAQANVTENIPLATRVEPEGPGSELFIASLPLAAGYQKRYAVVDRWGGHASTRVKLVTLSVSKRAVEDTSLGKRDIYELIIKSDDGSFQIREKVLAESPHYAVQVEYTRDGTTYPASEVSAIASEMK